MSEIYLHSLCSSTSHDWSLWSTKIGWDTPDPDITLCFQYTILNWVPLLFLWISCSIYIPMIWARSNVIYQRIGKFNIFKSTLIVLLLLIHIVNLCKAIGENIGKFPRPPAMYLQPVLSTISSILLIYLNRLIFLKGIYTSGVLFFYWLLQFVANLMILYSRYRRLKMEDRDIFRTVTATLEFVLVLASFMSNTFVDQAIFRNSYLPGVCSDSESLESRPFLKSAIRDNSILDGSNVPPESSSSFLSQLTFFWLTKLMVKGYRKPLEFNDLYKLEEDNMCNRIIPTIEKEWNKELERTKDREIKTSANCDQFKIDYQKMKEEDCSNKNDDLKDKNSETPSFAKALFHMIEYQCVISMFLRIFHDFLSFIQPILAGLLIQFIENPEDYAWHGYVIVLCIFITVCIQTIISQNYYYLCYRTGMRARTAIIGIVYRKALKLCQSQKESSSGEIMNLMSVDSQKINNACLFFHELWASCVSIFIAIAILWPLLGSSILPGFTFLLCLIPINIIVGMKIKNLQIKQMGIKDCRLKLLNEVFNGVKILKLYAWEDTFQKKIEEIRNEECRNLQATTFLYAIISSMWFCAPFLVSLFTFATYILSSSNNTLTVYKAFISITIFGILNGLLQFFPDGIINNIHAMVSLHRINKFLLLDELDELESAEKYFHQESPLKIINGAFSWEKNGLPVLKDINIDIEQGSLIAVVGAVGSGKTSLVSALIGEMFKISGEVKYSGSVAYVPQQAWCLNASVKDNILFNKPMNAYKYNRVIEACALLEDLKSFTSGDETEIGERGINLSGGQKQRISLARAVYQDSSIYILDDPLSAVDSHVGKHIFEQVIGPNGLLSSKIRILITHGLTYLPKVDKIFVMKDLKISESGSFEELLNNNGPFAELIKTYLEQDEEEAEISDDEDKTLMKSIRQKIPGLSSILRVHMESNIRSSVSEKSIKGQIQEGNQIGQNFKLIQEEFIENSGMKCSVYLSYIRSVTYRVAIAAIVSYIMFMTFYVATNVFLSKWTETQYLNDTQRKYSIRFFLTTYGTLGAGQMISILLQNLLMCYGGTLASKSIHNRLLINILRAPSIFFDTTPVGRILNKIGKDIDIVDVNIFHSIRHCLIILSLTLAGILVIIIAFPYLIVVLIPLSFICIMMQKLYIKPITQIKRIEAIKRSPIYSHFQESLAGASSIRSYNVGKIFIDKCNTLTDDYHRAVHPNFVSYRWLQLFFEYIGNIIILITGILIVVNRKTIGTGFTGLSISFSLQISWTLAFLIRLIGDLESNIVSVERIEEYMDMDQEAPWNIEETKPDPDWPERGEIEFVNYSVRYRPELTVVLKDLNFVVNAGEKLGIVGRTGAGKSTLALGLFRIMEPTQGTIIIDGVDICKLGLHSLRSKLAVIPQDPVLFCGTLRMNLDPLDEYSDQQLWDVLEMAHLKSFVNKSDEALNFHISGRGENLSVGQRQLFSLARVLLRKTKILILDEATSAIDIETDDLIQKSIRDHFQDCTILTIAHRLNTIMDYDRVLVLQQGMISELDTPQKLLRDTRSIFYSMVKDAGLTKNV